ncbi:hypothetical protein V8C86DRAFT_2474110 [Haematococcus lacustris]
MAPRLASAASTGAAFLGSAPCCLLLVPKPLLLPLWLLLLRLLLASSLLALLLLPRALSTSVKASRTVDTSCWHERGVIYTCVWERSS